MTDDLITPEGACATCPVHHAAKSQKVGCRHGKLGLRGGIGWQSERW